jgi:hypothetical protein
MTQDSENGPDTMLQSGLEAASSSARLQAALTAEINPRLANVDTLVARCAVEPDFFVRDMLTWALTRHDTTPTFDRVRRELGSEISQARSQALHTLSKIRDPRTWSIVTRELLQDPDDDVARAAWRTAVAAVPEDQAATLAGILATQLARGSGDVQRSLSRAFVALGPVVSEALAHAANHPNSEVCAHALATAGLIDNPDEDFEASIAEAKRTVALLGAPLIAE